MNLLPAKYPKRSTLPFLSFLVWSSVKGHLTPLKKANKRWIAFDPKKLQVWMVGHATVFINFFGTLIVTDPVFTNSLPFPKRTVPAGYKITDLPEIDYVLVSHAHQDHCHRRSLKRLSHRSKNIVLPKNCSDLIEDMPFERQWELHWQKKLQFSDLTIRAFRPIHWGQRHPWDSRRRGYNSYILQKNGYNIFFCGDSAYGKFFKEIGKKYKIQLAFLPIGAYQTPHARQNHMGPAEALRAFADLRAEHLIPIHWGNFRLSREPLREPVDTLLRLSEASDRQHKIHILNNGESFTL